MCGWFIMMVRIRTVFLLLGAVGLAFFGYRGARYFLDTTSPIVSVVGLEENGVYAGDMACMLRGSDGYRVKTISLWLDDTALVEQHKINRRVFEYPFFIPTKTLVDGVHKLKIMVRDASYRANTTMKEIPFFVDNVPLRAAFTVHDTTFKVVQGRTLHLQFQVNKPLKEAFVEIFSGKFICCQETTGAMIYECFVPIRTDELPSEYPFTIQITDRVGNRGTLEGKLDVVAGTFKTQQLAVGKVKWEKECTVGLPEAQFEHAVAELSSKSPRTKFWKGAFYMPCEQRGITTDFGTMRTSQERGRYRHDAIDISAPPKSIVWAAQDGVVVLKERFVHSGNTVVIDHGCGVLTFYFHLDSYADINVGDPIKKGKPVGRLGMTGYASGYHLHWELRINNIPVDPVQWTRYEF